MLEHLLTVSSGVPLPSFPDSGPGPTTLAKYDPDNDAGYFGTITETSLFTYAQVEAKAKTPLPGAASNRTNNAWIKAYWKGKIVFMPTKTIRTGTTWADIYRAGFMYGIDGNGRINPATGPVNQLTKITLTDGSNKQFVFKIRAVSGYPDDPAPAAPLQSRTILSEYTCIRERLAPTGNAPVGFAWAALGTISGQTMSPECLADGTKAMMLNNNSNYTMRTMWDITTSSFCNFYPVLELIEVINP